MTLPKVFYLSNVKCGSTAIKYMVDSHPDIDGYWSTKKRDMNMFSFTVIRNPWIRAASCYCQFKRTRPNLCSDMSFKTFLDIATDTSIKMVDRSRLVTNCSWKFLHESIRIHLHPYRYDTDIVCKLEDIETGWNNVCNALQVQTTPVVWVHRSNNYNKIPYHEFYDKYTIGLVEEYFEDVINEFDYTYEECKSLPSPKDSKLSRELEDQWAAGLLN
jgi:hypothetical protein